MVSQAQSPRLEILPFIHAHGTLVVDIATGYERHLLCGGGGAGGLASRRRLALGAAASPDAVGEAVSLGRRRQPAAITGCLRAHAVRHEVQYVMPRRRLNAILIHSRLVLRRLLLFHTFLFAHEIYYKGYYY